MTHFVNVEIDDEDYEILSAIAEASGVTPRVIVGCLFRNGLRNTRMRMLDAVKFERVVVEKEGAITLKHAHVQD